jgi:uncharacterized protein YyaL (SSP411 family)
MEHESFEDTTVAQIMNEHFISIKVDREERPDVDQIYMDAVQIISGRGGWPLNAICLPDGRPVYAGTYFQRENWKQVLMYLDSHFRTKREELMEQAAEITRGINVMDKIPFVSDTTYQTTDRALMFSKIDSAWDYEKGGRMGAPKFPMPITMAYLLQNYYYTKNEKALKAVTVTLDNMAKGGLYDNVGGGFARYSVDDSWTIPHFEKMLYDNAQLVSLYSDAYRIIKNEGYKKVVYETLAYIQREMSNKDGGFYSAQDADSEGEEGKYYVWTYEELKTILGVDFEAFAKVYDISHEGNFEEGKINLRQRGQGEQLNTSALIDRCKSKLLAVRSKRIAPLLDDKMLTAWNSLMIKGYVDAHKAFGDKHFLEVALQSANHIRKQCTNADYSLYRNYKNSKARINGFLDDYSFTIEAYIALYQATFDEQWLTEAKALTDYAIAHFYNKESGVFYYTSSKDAPLIARKTETSDNVIPSSNSSMAKTLFLLGHYYAEENYLSIAHQQMMNMKEYARGHTAFYAGWAMLMDGYINEPFEIAIVGENAPALKLEFDKHYLPNTILSGASNTSNLSLLKDKYKAGETWIYVCKNKTCGLPVRTVAEAMSQVTH